MKAPESGVYSAKQLERKYKNPAYIPRLVQEGHIKKIGRGYYATDDIAESRAISMIVKQFHPDAIVSKGSILAAYELIDSMPEKLQLDVGRQSSTKNETDLFVFHRTVKAKADSSIVIDGISLPAYSPERAIFESLLLTTKPHISATSRAVAARYIKLFTYDADALERHAEAFGSLGKEYLRLIQSLREALDVF